ncbi:Regulatory protein BlaR1 [Paludisphaera borealis]|uniref:Regulatory protein BlaR1 n=2 Tax=Paludisphaera borealis TaxID=1387353 RepID=A0A1U7CN53_9BACT|nr:Regulatory protein BlaR1 [Paludisphaera borealis]
MTWGFLHLKLLLPADASHWGPRRLRAVLLHEFAHIRRHDTIPHMLTQFVCAFYWFPPLVWLAARRLHEECEHARDDLVLESGVKPSDYAEELLGLLVPGFIPSAALAMTGRSELEVRLRAILDEKTDRRPITRRTAFIVAIFGVSSTAALATLQAPNPSASQSAAAAPANSASTATQPPKSTPEKLAVTCVDSDGKPVAGAEVHLYQFVGRSDEGRFVHSGPFTTDGRGKAVCSDATLYDGGNFDRWFYARVPGRLVGAGRSAKWTNRAAFNAENRVVMQASKTVDGHVTLPAGFDPTKVTVRVRTLHIATGPGAMDYESFPREDSFPGLDTSLPKIFDCRPDPKGRIQLSDVPVRGWLYLVTSAVGLGEAQWSNIRNRENNFDQPIHIAMEEEGFLSGRVLSPDGKPAVGMKVTARLSSSGCRQNLYLSSFRAVSDAEGAFSLPGLPQTEVVLTVLDPKKNWTFRPLENILVQPHQDPKLTLKLESGVRVGGRVLTTDGKPVGGAAISAVASESGGPGLADDQTDADGRYELRLPGGDAYLYFNSLPDGFAYPTPQIVKRLQIKPAEDDVQHLDFTLQRKPK